MRIMILRRVYSNRVWMELAIAQKLAFHLLTYGFNIKRKNIKENKEVLEVLIHLS